MLEVIVCQTCEEVIAFQEANKAGTLYGTCGECQTDKVEE